MAATSASIVRQTMFGAKNALANLVSASESNGSDDLLLYRARYTEASCPTGVFDHHMIVVNVGASLPAECIVGAAELNHVTSTGNVTVIPADTEWKAALVNGSEAVVAAIPKARLALVAASRQNELRPIEVQLRGENAELVSILDEMAACAQPHAADVSAWHLLADDLVDVFSSSYSSTHRRPVKGALAPKVVARINGFLAEHLDETISIDELADVAKQTRSHFPRLFRRTIGMSPHQYVVRYRLRRARSLIRSGRALAEAAVEVGFTDQSHFTHWLRRIYGTTPRRMSP